MFYLAFDCVFRGLRYYCLCICLYIHIYTFYLKNSDLYQQIVHFVILKLFNEIINLILTSFEVLTMGVINTTAFCFVIGF